jgi:hypothetical protein
MCLEGRGLRLLVLLMLILALILTLGLKLGLLVEVMGRRRMRLGLVVLLVIMLVRTLVRTLVLVLVLMLCTRGKRNLQRPRLALPRVRRRAVPCDARRALDTDSGSCGSTFGSCSRCKRGRHASVEVTIGIVVAVAVAVAVAVDVELLGPEWRLVLSVVVTPTAQARAAHAADTHTASAQIEAQEVVLVARQERQDVEHREPVDRARGGRRLAGVVQVSSNQR